MKIPLSFSFFFQERLVKRLANTNSCIFRYLIPYANHFLTQVHSG